MEFISQFITWPFLIFCLGLAAITFVVRRLLEFVMDRPSIPLDKNSIWWRDRALPLLPIILGGIIAFFAKMYPFPEMIGQSAVGRVFFGLVGGLFSSFAFNYIKRYLNPPKQDSSVSNQQPPQDPPCNPGA